MQYQLCQDYLCSTSSSEYQGGHPDRPHIRSHTATGYWFTTCRDEIFLQINVIIVTIIIIIGIIRTVRCSLPRPTRIASTHLLIAPRCYILLYMVYHHTHNDHRPFPACYHESPRVGTIFQHKSRTRARARAYATVVKNNR